MELLIVLVCAGLVAGFLGSLGMGSAIYLVLFMVFALHLRMRVVIGVSLSCIVAVCISGGLSYLKQGLVDQEIAILLGIPMTAGAISGSIVAVHLSNWLLMIIFGALFVGIGVVSLVASRINLLQFGRFAGCKQNHLSTFLRLQGSYYDTATDRRIEYEVVGATVGIFMSYAAGFAMVIGAGAGILIILVMSVRMNVPIKVAIGTSRLMVGMAAVAGSLAFFRRVHVEWHIAVPAATGALIGAFLGSLITNRIKSTGLRAALGVLIAYFGYMLVDKGLVQGFGVHLPGAVLMR